MNFWIKVSTAYAYVTLHDWDVDGVEVIPFWLGTESTGKVLFGFAERTFLGILRGLHALWTYFDNIVLSHRPDPILHHNKIIPQYIGFSVGDIHEL